MDGEVYKVRDGKLGRDVAIKVLPEEVSRDKQRSDRLEREATGSKSSNGRPNEEVTLVLS